MPDLSLLIGPFVVGSYFNAILYGVLLVQANIYYSTSKGDRLWMRYLVLFLIIAETVDVIADFELIWQPLITENGTSRALEVSPTALRAEPVVTATISTLVEIYMGWRIRKLTSSNLLFGLIAFLAFSSLVGGVSSTILVSLMPEYSQFINFQGAILTWLISSATADIVIAVSLVVYLVKNKGNFKATDTVIDRIIRVTVQTGALTSIAAISDCLTFVLDSHSTLQFIWDLPLAKLYTISLLSSLNARAQWQRMLDKDRNTSFIDFAPGIQISESPVSERVTKFSTIVDE
ncbi:hypothetical protein BT96DRAFT_996014 [Gymnopus androsaceus JB14]|uniref:DUF6534 domain-containing protein n=1 Tax=Gymnopus androsaceus JB14 TaxID=1447944 RepID=A0A6A4HJX2_9AGAR|nr:hypothetical protein BT96DRAFT_996014 [Gymnopus androsaceus JB14]